MGLNCRCIHVCAFAHVHTHSAVCAGARMYTHTMLYAHVRACTHTQCCMCTCAHVHTQCCMHTCAHVHTHNAVCACAHVHTHNAKVVCNVRGRCHLLLPHLSRMTSISHTCSGNQSYEYFYFGSDYHFSVLSQPRQFI